MAYTYVQVQKLPPFEFGEQRELCSCGHPATEIRITVANDEFGCEELGSDYLCNACGLAADNSDPYIGY